MLASFLWPAQTQTYPLPRSRLSRCSPTPLPPHFTRRPGSTAPILLEWKRFAGSQPAGGSIRQGGGAKAIDAQHGKKRLTARERLAL